MFTIFNIFRAAGFRTTKQLSIIYLIQQQKHTTISSLTSHQQSSAEVKLSLKEDVPSNAESSEKAQSTPHTTIDVDGDHQKQIDKGPKQSGVNGTQNGAGLGSANQQVTAGETMTKSKLLLMILMASAAAIIVALLWYSFGWTSGLPALVVAILATMLVAFGWRWFYIAAITSKRDIT